MLDKAGLVGSELCHGRKDFISGGIFYGLFLALKIKYCITNEFEFGNTEEHQTFKGFTDGNKLLNLSQKFKMMVG